MDDRLPSPPHVTATPIGELPLGVTFVASTRRLAHHLRSRHDLASLARGLRTWRTPDVVTWSELLQRQFELDRAAGRTQRRWLSLQHARMLWEQLVGRDAGMTDVLAPAGLGAVAYRSWTLLHQYRIPYAALAEVDSAEARAFARWVAAYQQRLQQGGWLDPALAASSVGSFAPGTHLHFVGFDPLTPEQAEFVARLRESGVDVAVDPSPADDVPIVGELIECNDFEAELDAAARWIAASLQHAPDARVGLIVPALAQERGRVRRALDRVLVPAAAVTGGTRPESAAYELAAARPLADRPVVAGALGWLDAATSRPLSSSIGALLLGAFDAGAAPEATGRAELDVELRRAGFGGRGFGMVAAAARRRNLPVTAQCLEGASTRARRWSGRQLPSHWALEFAGLLRDVGWPGADPDSTEHQALQRWQTLLGEFGASDDVVGPVPVSTALHHLRSLAQATAFEPQEIAAPVLVIDPETAVGMQFDAVWICRLDAGGWPPPASPDPFLPREWQARQRIPGATAELAEAGARCTLQRLTRAAPQVICSVSRFEDEAPLLPSALVADLPRRDVEQRWPGSTTTAAIFDARPTLERIPDSALPAFAEHQVVRGGARLLELQAACPFRAAVELRLGGVELEDPAVGIEPTERGTLVHAVLQAFWEDVREQAALVAMSDDTRRQRVRDHTQRTLAPLRSVADEVQLQLLDLEQRWLEARVLELLEQDARREPFTVAHVEAERVVEVGGVQVKIKLDRVDRLADGSYAVIDYKTSASAKPAAWMDERPELPQLPLYARTIGRDDVSAVAFGVVRRGATGYSGFARAAGVFTPLRPFDPGKSPFREYADWKTLLEAWDRRLDALAREHAAGHARLAPNPTKACRHCHLPGLCRSAQAFVAGEEGDDNAAG